MIDLERFVMQFLGFITVWIEGRGSREFTHGAVREAHSVQKSLAGVRDDHELAREDVVGIRSEGPLDAARFHCCGDGIAEVRDVPASSIENCFRIGDLRGRVHP